MLDQTLTRPDERIICQLPSTSVGIFGIENKLCILYIGVFNISPVEERTDELRERGPIR